MKRFKKLTALALAVVMAVGMMAPAWATEGPTDDNNGNTPETVDTTGGDNTGNTGSTTDDGTTPSTSGTPSITGGYSDDIGTTGKITITNPVEGATYSAYKLFDVKTVSENGKIELAYTVPEDGDWAGLLTDSGNYYVSYNTKDGVYFVTWNDNSEKTDQNVQAFAQLAKRYLNDKGITPTVTPVTHTSGTTVTISGLSSGYYLVTSTGGSLCILCTLRDGVTDWQVDDKQSQPTIKKEVWEDRFGDDGVVASNHLTDHKGWGGENDAEIGQTVWYRTTITPGGNPQNYTLLDFMYPGLTIIPSSFVVYKNGSSLNSGYNISYGADWYMPGAESGIRNPDVAEELMAFAADDAANLAISESMKGQINGLTQVSKFTSYTFAIQFEDSVLADMAETDELVVIYSATLNENALISPEGNENITVLGYGNGSASLSQISILQQAAQSMLAQSNQRPQNVLGMLQSDDIPVEDDESGISAMAANGNENLSSGYKVDRTGNDAVDPLLTGYKNFTLPMTTVTYTYQLDLVKVDGYNTVLPGAQFELKRSEGGDPIQLVEYTEPTTKWANWVGQGVLSLLQDLDDYAVEGLVAGPRYYRPAKPGETGVTQVTAGVITFVGLDEGTYYLEELVAPSGYNKLSEPIKIEIQSTVRAGEAAHGMVVQHNLTAMNAIKNLYGSVKPGVAVFTVDGGKNWKKTVMGENDMMESSGKVTFTGAEGGLAVVNMVGNELPHTGGMGTTLFYVVGGVLVVGAGILLIVKKRMKNEE